MVNSEWWDRILSCERSMNHKFSVVSSFNCEACQGSTDAGNDLLPANCEDDIANNHSFQGFPLGRLSISTGLALYSRVTRRKQVTESHWEVDVVMLMYFDVVFFAFHWCLEQWLGRLNEGSRLTLKLTIYSLQTYRFHEAWSLKSLCTQNDSLNMSFLLW